MIGCGLISEAHVRAWARHAGRARIVACCDLDPDRAAARAAQVAVEGAEGDPPRIATDLSDLLADPDIDAIDVCTPHHVHAEAVIAAAGAGKHISCQKPLAKTIAECDAMIAAARAAGVTLFYAEVNRTLPAAVLARRAVEEGRIGRLVGLQAGYAHWQGGEYLRTAWRYDPAVTGGGQLLDGGVHAIDLLLHVGGPVAAVSCFTTRFRPELGGEDTASLTLRFAGGHLGSLFSSQAVGIWYPGAPLTVLGTEGALVLGHWGDPPLTLHRPDLPDRREVLLERDRNSDGFATMIGRFLDAIEGMPNPSPGEVGREDLRVVLAAYRSEETGREVVLG